jgi:hypothetical protein
MVSIEEALQAEPVANSSRFLMGVEVGVNAVGRDLVVHQVSVISELKQDRDFQVGFLRGVCVELLCICRERALAKPVYDDGLSEDAELFIEVEMVGLDRFLNGRRVDPVFDDRAEWGDDRMQLDACRHDKRPRFVKGGNWDGRNARTFHAHLTRSL